MLQKTLISNGQTVERWAVVVKRADDSVDVLGIFHTRAEAEWESVQFRRLYLGVEIIAAHCTISLEPEN